MVKEWQQTSLGKLMTALLIQFMLVSLPLHILTFRASRLPAVRVPPSFPSVPWLGRNGVRMEFFGHLTVAQK